jgi:ligand-binding sensor domain-containing protein
VNSLIKRIILSCFLLLAGFVSAQNSYFRNYSVDHGLPFIQVQTIFQDSKGYLWSGGYGGLSQFDGTRFTNFSPRNGLVSHSVTAINEDSKGNLWIGTNSGVSCYDGKSFKNYTKANGLPDNSVTYIVTDSLYVWIGTLQGVARFDGKNFSTFGTNTGLPTNVIFQAYKDEADVYWMGSDKGLHRFDSKGVSTIPNWPEGKASNVYAVTTSGGKVFAGTAAGVYIYDEHTGKITKPEHPLLQNAKVNALVKDRRGMVWAATNSGLFRIHNGIVKQYKPSEDLNSNIVISLFIDYEGNLWVGTYNGMFRYRDDQFTTYGIHSGMKSAFAFQMTRSNTGDLWVATTDGLHVFDGKNFKVLTDKNGLPGNSIFSCIEDHNGSIWAGTEKGIAIIEKGRTKQLLKKDGLASDSGCYITEDSKGRMLIGGCGGITVIDKGVVSKHTFRSPYTNDFSVWKILETAPDNYVIGTYQGGIFSFDGKTFKCLNDSLGIKENVVLDVVTDNDGILYFATFDGIFMYIPESYPNKRVQRLIHFNEENGMSSDLVYCLAFDKEFKYLWAGTNQGINRIDVAAYKKLGRKKIEVYGKEDGFMGTESNSNGIYTDKDGSIWFGTVNGLIRYNPYEFISNIYEPRINLTGISVFYHDTSFVSNMSLPYDANHVSFRFTATSLTNPSKVRYRIMLEGFDRSWSPVTVSTFATYSNLPPGKYTFKVQAANNEGLWSTHPAEFSFEIRKAWWNTWVFRLSMAGAILAIILFGFRVRSQQIRRKERQVAKQNLEMSKLELKALRAQMNPHFIFNSLNSIQHFILQSEEVSAVKYLNKFAKLIRIILNNSEKPSITLREELEALNLYLELEELRFGDKFSYAVTIDSDIDIDYYEVPPLILQPYVENAILHGLNPKPQKGMLEIIIKKHGDHIVCTVLDNGIGRKQAMEMKGQILRKPHVSHGTRITRERLEILNRSFHSELSVNITDLNSQSGEGTGTRVDVFIPA